MRSLVGSRRVGLAALVAAGVALPSCDLFLPHRDGRSWSNESAAMAYVRAYLSAQNQFKRSDFYAIGKLVYANPEDGVGYSDLYQVGYGQRPRGEVLGLIDIELARARWAREDRKPRAGYYFADLIYRDHEINCGLCAVPASYNRSGRNIFIIDVTGTVYQKDAAAVYPGIQTGNPVPPLTRYPDNKAITTWVPVGCE